MNEYPTILGNKKCIILGSGSKEDKILKDEGKLKFFRPFFRTSNCSSVYVDLLPAVCQYIKLFVPV